jgi:hypothetical protein
MIAIFIGALFYVARMIYSAISPKKGSCATGCGKCAANFDQIPSAKS